MNKTANMMIIMPVLLIGLLNSCASGAQNKSSKIYEEITSTSAGIYYDGEKALLEASFINAVNRWLRRYSPQIITRDDNYIKTRVKYDYLYDIELFIKENNYDVVVTFAQARRRPPDAREDAVHLSTGVAKVMEDYIANRSRARD